MVLAAELEADLWRSLLLFVLGSRGIAELQANWDLSEAWPMSLAPTNGDVRCQRVKNLSKKPLVIIFKRRGVFVRVRVSGDGKCVFNLYT